MRPSSSSSSPSFFNGIVGCTGPGCSKLIYGCTDLPTHNSTILIGFAIRTLPAARTVRRSHRRIEIGHFKQWNKERDEKARKVKTSLKKKQGETQSRSHHVTSQWVQPLSCMLAQIFVFVPLGGPLQPLQTSSSQYFISMNFASNGQWKIEKTTLGVINCCWISLQWHFNLGLNDGLLPSENKGYDQNRPLTINPFTPKSDQCQISPAASPEMLHHTVWRTWLFIASSDRRWLYYTFSLHHSYNCSSKGWENTLFELRNERVNY